MIVVKGDNRAGSIESVLRFTSSGLVMCLGLESPIYAQGGNAKMAN